jgi:hypothetical protein
MSYIWIQLFCSEIEDLIYFLNKVHSSAQFSDVPLESTQHNLKLMSFS